MTMMRKNDDAMDGFEFRFARMEFRYEIKKLTKYCPFIRIMLSRHHISTLSVSRETNLSHRIYSCKKISQEYTVRQTLTTKLFNIDTIAHISRIQGDIESLFWVNKLIDLLSTLRII